RIVERSSGIPFFVEELAASLDALDRIPRGLEELLRARVDALSAEAQQLVRAVAAGTAGGPVPDAVLASVVGWEPVELAARLREAVTRYVLVVSDDSYDFRHALMREVVEADLLPGERAALHAAFARALETLDEGAGDDPATANRIALHLLAAHDLPGAAAWSWAAGRVDDRALAFMEAAEHYQRVLELWDRIDDAARVVGVARIEVALAATQSLLLSGDPGRAVALARSELAIDARSSQGDDGECRASLVCLLGQALRRAGRMDESTDVLTAALAASPAEVTRARTELKCELGIGLALQVGSEEAQKVVDDALADARLVGDPA